MARSTLVAVVVGSLFVALGGSVAGCARGLNGLGSESNGLEESGGSGGSGGAGGAQTTTITTTTSSTTSTTTSSTTSTTSSTTTTSTGSGNATCDGSGNCDTCGNCAIGGICATQTDACFNDADCSGLIDCLQICQDDVCANACADEHPIGMQLYMDLITCVLCDACLNSCDGASSGACL